MEDANFPTDSDPDLARILWDLSPKIENILRSCEWRDSKYFCGQLFFPIVTEMGICYSFNSLKDKDMFRTENLHSDYKNFENQSEFNNNERILSNVYPRNTYRSGTRAGLHIDLIQNEDDSNILCSGPIKGFKIFLHPPKDISPTSKEFFYVQPKTDLMVAIKPNIIYTSKELKDDPAKRYVV